MNKTRSITYASKHFQAQEENKKLRIAPTCNEVLGRADETMVQVETMELQIATSGHRTSHSTPVLSHQF